MGSIKEIKQIIRERKKELKLSEKLKYLSCARCNMTSLIHNTGEEREFKRLHDKHNLGFFELISLGFKKVGGGN